jgi:hypothetical protein
VFIDKTHEFPFFAIQDRYLWQRIELTPPIRNIFTFGTTHMTEKELEARKKKTLAVTEFSPNTKSSIITSDLNYLARSIRKQIASKKTVAVMLIELKAD